MTALALALAAVGAVLVVGGSLVVTSQVGETASTQLETPEKLALVTIAAGSIMVITGMVLSYFTF